MGRNQRDFTIGLVGLSSIEVSAIKSILNMTNAMQSRTRTYRIIDNANLSQAEIYIVNPTTGRNLVTLMRLNKDGAKPVIYIAQEFNKTLQANEHMISRSHLSSKLLGLLDKVSVSNLNYAPELVIGNESTVTTTVMKDLSSKSASDKPATVLVIDDSESVRTQMSLGMKLHNINCDFGENASEGIDLAKKNQYQMIFLDVVMPGMDGYKACKIIKSDPMTKNTPVILLTSRNSPFDKVRGVMSGCDKYLGKPIHAAQLEEVLREYTNPPVDHASGS